jgi:hypothetical protein
MKRIGFASCLCLLLSAALAVTYRVDPANGPETLATEVQEAFAAWTNLSDKVEASETQENPESVFQYGATERFGPDTLSLTVQRQQEGRSLIFLISPNAENRRRILLHETGIAIGLEPQIPGTPLPALPGTTPAPPSKDAPSEEAPSEEGQGETFETTPLPETPESPESTSAPTHTQSTEETSGEEQSTPEGQTAEGQVTEDQTSAESTTEQPTDTQSSEDTSESTTADTSTETTTTDTSTTGTEETTTTETTPEQPSDEQATSEQPSETPAASLTPNSVMNPSIAPDDSVELGDFERQLLERLELFVSEDINRDGVVNFYDLVALAQAFGRSGVNDPADINRDGLIDQQDVEALRSAYTFSDPAETAPGSSPTEETEATDGTTPPEGTTPEGTPEQTPPDGTPPDDLPPQDDGPADGSSD